MGSIFWSLKRTRSEFVGCGVRESRDMGIELCLGDGTGTDVLKK